MKLWFLVVILPLCACVPQFTDCASHEDCEPGYGCSPEDLRCHPSCRNGVCDDGLSCRDTVCMEPVAHGTGSSSSGGLRSSAMSVVMESSSSVGLPSSSLASSAMSAPGSSRPASSSLGTQSSSMVAPSSSVIAQSSSMRPQSPDPCNGSDDDGDGVTDEDGYRVVGTPIVLSTDSPPTRIGVAPSEEGFFVTYSAYCLSENSVYTDVYANHVRFNGSLTVGDGPCEQVKGLRLLRSPMTRSRHPAVASEGGRSAGVAWSEGDDMNATLQVAEVSLRTTGSTTTLALSAPPISAGRMDSSYEGGDVEVYASIAAGGGVYMTALTQGEGAMEKVYVQRITRSGMMLQVQGNSPVSASSGAEVAITAVSNGFFSTWMDLDDAKGSFLTSSGATVGSLGSYDPGTPFVFEVAATGMGFDAIAGWQIVEPADLFGIRRINLAIMESGSSTLDPILEVQPPDGRGYYGLAHSTDEEILFTHLDHTSSKPVLKWLDGRTGNVCSSLVIQNATDVGHTAVAFSGDYALVLFRRGNDDEQASNTVEALLLQREMR